MKNKIQKTVGVFTIVIMISSSNGYTRESYAGRGALIGGVSMGTVGGILGYSFVTGLCESDYNCADAGSISTAILLFGGIGGAVGALLGAGIGATIPKNPKFTVTPTFNPTSGAVEAGINLSVKF